MEKLGRVGLPVFVGGVFSLALLAQRWTGLLVTDFVVGYCLLCALILFGLVAGIIFSAMRWARAGDRRAAACHRRWLIRQACTIVLAGGVIGLNFAYGRGLPAGSFAMRFEATAWKKAVASRFVDGDISVRQKMLGGAIEHARQARDRGEVIRLLGPSEEQGYFSAACHELIYRTGIERGSLFGVDSEWLLIWFDDRGRVDRCEVWTD